MFLKYVKICGLFVAKKFLICVFWITEENPYVHIHYIKQIHY
jgi:hypothetical protein